MLTQLQSVNIIPHSLRENNAKPDIMELKILKNNLFQNGYKLGYYSGSKGDRGYIYKRARSNGIWVSDDLETAKQYAKMGGSDGPIRKIAIRLNNPLDLRSLGIYSNANKIKKFLDSVGVNLPFSYYKAFNNKAIEEDQSEWFVYSIVDGENWKTDRALAIQAIMKAGYESLILKDTHYGAQSDSYVLFNSSDVKLDSLNTVGDDGQPIKAELRFDPNNPDIRY